MILQMRRSSVQLAALMVAVVVGVIAAGRVFAAQIPTSSIVNNTIYGATCISSATLCNQCTQGNFGGQCWATLCNPSIVMFTTCVRANQGECYQLTGIGSAACAGCQGWKCTTLENGDCVSCLCSGAPDWGVTNPPGGLSWSTWPQCV